MTGKLLHFPEFKWCPNCDNRIRRGAFERHLDECPALMAKREHPSNHHPHRHDDGDGIA